jgi:hypothetical protein
MSLFQFALSVRCPFCKRGPNHWCRDGQGQCISPHRERAKEALRVHCGILSTLRQPKRQVQPAPNQKKETI